MSSLSLPLPRRLFPLPEQLVRSPLSLLCLALLANAVFQPYLGVFHDARLYAFYLESRLEPAQGFDQDLYLAYGSQDRYSLFSLLMFPVVKLVGLEAGIFAVYVLSKALLFWGFQRLTRALVRDETLTAVIVLFLAVATVPFGGNEVFHVNEAFLTPRLGAAGLVLLGLERMLARKILGPCALLLAALLLHPLMGMGGVLTFVLWWLFGRLNWWQLGGLFLVGTTAAVGVLAYEPLGTRLLGHVDDRWRAVILQICFFINPTEWALEDWVRMAWDCGLLVVAACTFARHSSRFLWAVLGAGLIGLAGTLVGVESNYLLLLQTSPYRTFWLTEFVAVPLGLMAVSSLWQRGSAGARCLSLGLLLYVTDERTFTTQTVLYLVLLGGAAVLFIVWRRGLQWTPTDPQWLWPWAWFTFLAGCGLLALFAVLVVATALCAPPSAEMPIHPAGVFRMIGEVTPHLVALIAVCQLARFAVAALGAVRRFQVAAAGTAVVYLAVLTYLAVAPWYLTRYLPGERHTEFVAGFLQARRGESGRAPCVYWDTDIYQIWFRLRANSYVTIYQMAGCAFNRETAVEGKRRIRLVALFEADADRKSPKPMPPRWQQFFADFRDCPPDAEPPTRADLLRLAREEALDYAVLSVAVDDLYCATDGAYYIYDCKRLRKLARGEEPPASVTLAGPGR